MLLPGKRLPLSQILTHPGPLPNVESKAIKGYSSGAVAPDWHISGEPKPGFPTVLRRAPESSLVVPSPTASKQYQARPLELFSAIPYSCEDSSLGEIQPAESLISCSWSQKFLFDVPLSKNLIIFRGKKKIYIYIVLWAWILNQLILKESYQMIIFLQKVLGAE